MNKITEHLGEILIAIVVFAILIIAVLLVGKPLDNFVSSVTTIAFRTNVTNNGVSNNGGSGSSGDFSESAGDTVPSDTSGPVITIDQELGISSDSPLVVGNWSYTVSGTVTDESGVAFLTVNGTKVTVGENGIWSTTLTLTQSVVTEVSVVAKDSNGNTSTEIRYLKYGVKSSTYLEYNGVVLPNVGDFKVHAVIYYRYNKYYLCHVPYTHYGFAGYVDDYDTKGELYVRPGCNSDRYVLNGDTWEENGSAYPYLSGFWPLECMVWSNKDIKYNGEVIFAGSTPVPVYE